MQSFVKISVIVTTFITIYQLQQAAGAVKCPFVGTGCPAINTELMCPAIYREPGCTDTSPCPKGQICCKVNCGGVECVYPEKPGACPPNTRKCIQWPPGEPYSNMCATDANCPCQQKCCASCPGPQCMAPDTTVSG